MNTKIHFLVVNDSDVMQKVIVALLKEIGYVRVSEADDGKTALRTMETAKAIGSPIDFVITDCSMPEMNGLEMIRAIRSNPDASRVPVLMVTAEAKMENILAAVDAGADSYLVKPFRADTFGKKIEGLLVERGLKEPQIVF